MKHTYSILLILLLCFFGACTENTLLTNQPEQTPDEEGLEEVSLNLESLPVRIIGEEWNAEAQTRVASTDNPDENKISNIWVLQYDNAGTKLLTAPRYYALNPVITTKGSINVMLRPDTDNNNSVIHIIANTNNPNWLKSVDVSTPAKLNNLTFTFNNESAVYGGTNKNLLMSGNTTATIKAGATNNLGTINLKRMVAKINFKYTLAAAVQGKLTVTKITIENIPNIIKVGEPTATYPTTLTSCSYNEITAPTAGSTYTWYIPENRQGSTANTDEKAKNEKAPANAAIIRLYIDSQLDGSNYVYTLYPGVNKTNDFNIKRNYDYEVSLTLNSSATDSRVMAAPANCFVMKPQTSITFDPYDRTEKGGGLVYSQYVNKNESAKKITKVSILWQTGNGTDYAIGNNSTGNLVYMDNKDKIHVTAGKVGNAVIAGYNSSNEIVWSWHIWVNDNMPAQISKAVPYTTYDWDANGIKSGVRVSGKPVMSCNLGALKNEVGASSYGLLYQWGRKDPFPQGKEDLHHNSYPYSSQYIVDVYDNAAKQITMTSTIGTGELFQTIMASSSTGTIGYVLKHPTHFIKTTDVENSSNPNEHVNDGDWCWNHNDRLWGGKPVKEATKKFQTNTPHNLLLADNGATEKSIFDPCPSGWMLAPGDMWLGFTINGYNVSDYAEINCSETNAEENKNNYGYHIYMQGWKTGVTAYFPSQGLRQCNGAPWRNGECGNYHTSTPGEGGTVYILHMHTPSSIKIYEESYAYTRRSVAGSVRCVRETK